MRNVRTLVFAGWCLTGLGVSAEAQCLGDFDRSGTVAIGEIITAVRNSLDGCPAPGTRFRDDGDGTILDQKTGLLWEKKLALDGSPSAADAHDADRVYAWSGLCSASMTYCQPTAAAAELCRARAAGGSAGCAQCAAEEGSCSATETVWTWVAALNQARFAGRADWRLPTVSELHELVDYTRSPPPMVDAALHGASCGAACADPGLAACACTHSASYWTASAYVANPAYAWTVDFGTGSVLSVGSSVSQNARHGAERVRAVSGGS